MLCNARIWCFGRKDWVVGPTVVQTQSYPQEMALHSPLVWVKTSPGRILADYCKHYHPWSYTLQQKAVSLLGLYGRLEINYTPCICNHCSALWYKHSVVNVISHHTVGDAYKDDMR